MNGKVSQNMEKRNNYISPSKAALNGHASTDSLGPNRHPVKNYEQIVNGAQGGASQRLAHTYGLIGS